MRGKCDNLNYGILYQKVLDNVRNPYAISLSCIALGFIANEDAIPIIYDKYFELKKHIRMKVIHKDHYLLILYLLLTYMALRKKFEEHSAVVDYFRKSLEVAEIKI